MPVVYLVPGLGGTTLGYDPGGGRPLWVDYTRIALGQLGAMRLAADGISPGPPDGVQLYPGFPLPDYYNPCLAALESSLKPLGYSVRSHGYDWRLLAERTGPELATRIRSEVVPGDPCTLVAHSFGGLVARQALTALASTGQAALVKRVITLGSPHQGSYGVVALFSLDSDQLEQVRNLTLATATLLFIISPLVAPFPWSQPRLVRLAATWPALYETLPLLGGSDAQNDPNRVAVYTGNWPADRSISQPWLDYARGPWQSYLRAGGGLDAAVSFTSVAGLGLPTISRLAFPGILGDKNAYTTGSPGDGQVTQASALLDLSTQILVAGSHTDLPNQLAISGDLARLVTAAPPPPPPPPPPRVLAGRLVPILAGPPVPSRAFATTDP